jgi:positive regulator of sigma E activity
MISHIDTALLIYIFFGVGLAVGYTIADVLAEKLRKDVQ